VSSAISRRRFLQLGAAGAAGAAVVGFGLWRWTRDERDPWAQLFGDRVDDVREVGRRTVEEGFVTSRDAALDGLPTDGLEVRGTSVEITDAGAFARATRAAADAELDAGVLAGLEGFFFAPSELALAALVYLER